MQREASLQDIKKAFDRAVFGAERRSWIVGLLGLQNQDGTVSINVPDRNNWVYVALGPRGDQTITIARNDGRVPHRNFLPVQMKRSEFDGALVIQGIYNSGNFADVATSGDLENDFGVFWHNHRIGSGLEYEHQALLFDQGRAYWTGALAVHINSFRYEIKETGVWETWEGGSLDLTSFKPATSGHWAWVVVGVDPSDNTAVAVAGTSQIYATALTIGLIDDIDFLGYIPCAAIRLRNDATVLENTTAFFQDAHKWFGETSLALDDLTDVTNTTPTENDTMWYNGSNWETGRGHKINQDFAQSNPISSGILDIDAIDKQHGLYDVRGESGLDDDLVNISGGIVGDIITLYCDAPGTYGEIVVKTTGNINVPNDITLDTATKAIMLVLTLQDWQILSIDHRLTGATVTMPASFDTFVDLKARQDILHMHGTLRLLVAAQPLDSVPTDLVVTNGLSKLLIVINAGSDTAGTITVTGTSVDRDTKAETGSDTDAITVSGTTTDSTSTDANGNSEWAFTNAYITTKWFKGSVTLSTADLTLSDVDVYQIVFEQFNDEPTATIRTFDLTLECTNTAAWCDVYMFKVAVTGDTCVISTVSEHHITTAESEADKSYRLREGDIDLAVDGSSDGIWVENNLGPIVQDYWEDINVKIWYDIVVALNLT